MLLRNECDAIAPFIRLACECGEDQKLCESDVERSAGDEDSGRMRTSAKMRCEVIGERSAVMRHDDAIIRFCPSNQFGVPYAQWQFAQIADLQQVNLKAFAARASNDHLWQNAAKVLIDQIAKRH